jgi:hypothetical protein
MDQHKTQSIVVGGRYLVRYRGATQRLERTAVIVYLGEEGDTLLFSARPVAGTQRLPRSWIRAVEPVPAHTPTHIDRTVPRQARRFVVRRMEGYRRGNRRLVVWDTQRGGWADEARTSRRDAQDVCDELTRPPRPRRATPAPE